MVYEACLTNDVLNVFIRVLFGEARRRAHRLLGLRSSQCGAVTFVQRYGDALNANPHFHCLCIDGFTRLAAMAALSFTNCRRPRMRMCCAWRQS